MQQAESTWFLIADISGYTGYLAGVEIDHAQDIIADLIGTVVTALRPNLRLAKLEGDAAFVTAGAEKLDGSLLLDTIERCYLGFRRRRRDVRQATSCECNACMKIQDLNLKFVAHYGVAMHQRMAGRDELFGSDVIVVHRLLKNEVVEQLGIDAYALFTQSAIEAMAIDPGAIGMTSLTETHEHIGEVATWVHDLEARWQEEESRERVFVSAQDSVFDVAAETTAPPQVAWEFLTVPGRRVGWQTGLHARQRPGDRRDPGLAPVRLLDESIDRSHATGSDQDARYRGTGAHSEWHTIHWRYGAPKNARERAILTAVTPMFQEIFNASGASIVSQLEAELASRAAGAPPEPEPDLPAPKPGGVLAGVEIRA